MIPIAVPRDSGVRIEMIAPIGMKPARTIRHPSGHYERLFAQSDLQCFRCRRCGLLTNCVNSWLKLRGLCNGMAQLGRPEGCAGHQ